MAGEAKQIIYTHTDEAPALATYSFLPIIQAFVKSSNVQVQTRDISLAGRVLAQFPEVLSESQRVKDDLAELGQLCKTPDALIVKLPNISATVGQLKEAIDELQKQGYKVPDYPEAPKNDLEKDVQARYKKVTGSAVNPVLREGNSDRRASNAVKNYAKKHPHSMGAWSKDSKTHVGTMTAGDFFGSEVSCVSDKATKVKISFTGEDGKTIVLKDGISVLDGEVLDASLMRVQEYRDFLEAEIQDALKQDVLLSLHLKATMMKTSDPILFGHVVSVYFKDVFEKYASEFKELGVNPNLGLGDVLKKISKHPKKAEIEQAIEETYKKRPRLAMVDAGRGITNLHNPNDVIIDASMPKMIRESGQMEGLGGKMGDTKALIPDRSYSGIFQATIDFCKQHGAFDPKTMGSVPNVGLMAQAAEEYGSHDKTFELPASGVVNVTNSDGAVLLKQSVSKGDVFRMSQTKDLPIRDWVKLAVTRAKASGAPVIFWLDKTRSHDKVLIEKAQRYLKDHDTKGLEIHIMAPADACLESLKRAKEGKDTISATGNVLRDYNTDLFPILELGTSAKMLSIVPMLAGGGMYETGAGGSAPKHVQQFVQEGHLRWDSLGEFLALEPALMDLGTKSGNEQCKALSTALGDAIGKFLDENKNPSRKVKELDNRGSHFYLALYWAQALAAQQVMPALKAQFEPIAKALADQEKTIVNELIECQGKPVDLGGYFHPDPVKVAKAMRPSKTLNGILESVNAPRSKL
eukprot:gnl/MRDRNA2_/MRDRNA2_85317_c0_seq1.p1 gnl/MRDRNA2_/MRDRNA2_85317_c0~~gnl/MRDRNA2_/MRDRNA2_85317_c0_seq1.p1  ORF type:complete len:774 (+),score=178.78 gnl/MRDRNA2_/MRDRNA2_85317_c0_seq1:80-2323(+)